MATNGAPPTTEPSVVAAAPSTESSTEQINVPFSESNSSTPATAPSVAAAALPAASLPDTSSYATIDGQHVISTSRSPRIDDLQVDVVIDGRNGVTSSGSADNIPLGENELSDTQAMNESNLSGEGGVTSKMGVVISEGDEVKSSNSATEVTAEEMETMSMKVKIICQEKNILALKMELKAAELTVEAKEKVDVKKTRLIELLDAKLSAVEKRNAKLLDMMEQMLKEKEGNSNRLKDATKNMTHLTDRLIESEKMKTELLRINDELKKMLGNLETKGSQIAKLAKEKVLKYKDEADLMQIELTGLKNDAAETSAAAASARADAAMANNSPAAAAARSNLEAEGVSCWSLVEVSLKCLSDSLQAAGTVTPTADVIKEIYRANDELKVNVEKVRQTTSDRLQALSVENDQLRAVVDDFEAVQKRHEQSELKIKTERAEAQTKDAAKDKEIVELKEELVRVKGAIAQLIGIK